MTLSPTEAPLSGECIDARYEVLSILGKGGMGTVFAVLDQHTQRRCALKLLHLLDGSSISARVEKRMQREIRMLTRLDDPRIIRIFDWGELASTGSYYTMELIEDALTLQDYLALHRPSLSVRLHLLTEVLRALDTLHQHQVLHRDLKSSNVLCLVEEEEAMPSIKLIDLGIARWFDQDLRTQVTIETEPGTLLGSPPYMAPEMWRNDELDARADLYQAGILAFEILADHLPFAGTPHQLMFQHLHAFVPDLTTALLKHEPYLAPKLLPWFNALLRRATQKNPKDRFSNTKAFLSALQELCIALQNPEVLGSSLPAWAESSLPGEGFITSQKAPLIAPRRRWLGAVWLGLVLLLCSCGLALFWWSRASRLPVKMRRPQRPQMAKHLRRSPLSLTAPRLRKAPTITTPRAKLPVERRSASRPRSRVRVRPKRRPVRRYLANPGLQDVLP